MSSCKWLLALWLFLLASTTLSAADCNLNGVDDDEEIQGGVLTDRNANGVPDSCDLPPLSFGTVGERVSVAPEPRFVTAEDFDGDGLTDFVVGHRRNDLGMTSLLAVFLNRGDGRFDSGTVVDTVRLFAMAFADLDADGDLDLVTANGEKFQVFVNDGSGNFDEPGEIVAFPETRVVVLEDMDLDGAVDIVSFNALLGRLVWHRNLGANQFDRATSFVVAEPDESSSQALLAPLDFDADGDMDLALFSRGGVTLLQNADGGASMEAVESLPEGGGRGAVAMDVNGDGRQDLVGLARDAVTVWRHRQGVEFEEPFVLSIEAEAMVVADADADGDLDLFVTSREEDRGRLRLLRNPGDGTFRHTQSWASHGGVVGPGDFDGDGSMDLVIVGLTQASVLFQERREGFVFEEEGLPVRFPHFLDVGHLDGDDLLDVVTANSDQETTNVLFNRGDGFLVRGPEQEVGVPVVSVAAVDLNQNGTDDVVFHGRRGLLRLLNAGEGELGDPETFGRWPQGRSEYVAASDVDGDGLLDILAPGWVPRLLAVYFGDGDGGLSPALELRVGDLPWSVAAGDLDADGDVDLVTVNGLSSDLSILFQEMPRSFLEPAMTVPVEGAPRGMALGDFDGDGDLDIVTSHEETADAAILLNDGGGVFDVRALRFPIGGFPLGVAVADLDLDGALDVVALNREFGFSILPGRGDGTYGSPAHFGIANGPRHLVLADMDGDGDTDIVVAIAHFNRVAVMRNQIVPPASAVFPEGVPFRRGDGDGDLTLTIRDALVLLEHIFGDGHELRCAKAGDANDDGRLNLVDSIVIVSQLFGGAALLPEPFPDCGQDVTADSLRCEASPCE